MTDLQIAVAMYIAYLFGSFSSAIVVCKVMRLPDPRTQGSRNPGATNVMRIGGKKAAALTLLGDVLKGVIPILAAKWYGITGTGLALVAFSAFLGHLFPIFFRFEGGKGVATAIGCMLALCWPVAVCWIATWLLVAYLSRYVSLAGIVASLLAPLYMWCFTHNLSWTLMMVAIFLLLTIRHHENIARLLKGTESKIGKKK